MKNCILFETLNPVTKMSVGKSDGLMTLSGTFGVCGVVNNNKRIYETSNYKKVLEDMKQRIEQDGGIPGELEHPQTTNITLDNISHKITDINIDENGLVTGTIQLLNTPKGKIAQSIIEGGLPLYVSSRATGQIDKTGNVTLEHLFTYDLVGTPGFSQARMKLNESQICESFDSSNCVAIIENTGDDEPLITENNINKTKDNIMKEDIEKLQILIEFLQTEVNTLKESINSMNEENSSLQTEVSTLKETVSSLNEENVWLRVRAEENTGMTEQQASSIQNWIVNEYSPEVQKWVVSEALAEVTADIKDLKETTSSANSEAKSNILTNEDINFLADGIQQWLVEEYSKELQNWLISEIAPCIQNWITEEYSPVVQNWITEKQGELVDNKISEALTSTKSSKLESIEETLTLLESMSTTKPKYPGRTIQSLNENIDEPLFVRNMPDEFRPLYEMTSPGYKKIISNRAKLYDFTTEGALQRFWETQKWETPQNNIIKEDLSQIENTRDRQMKEFFRRKNQ